MSNEINVIREVTRSFSEEGREFTVVYQLGTQRNHGLRLNPDESKCFIRASSVEKDCAGSDKTSGYNIDFLYLDPKTGLRLFDMIAGAESPVMPVHLPEIVRDELSAFRHYEVKPCL